ncbi:hypothetical protein F5Y14DRAFT_223751 [Nemania sp. NC0429]|nr:hypothetical protein F5Y14DRAFT_223751 [Nemania sp. NC0429]
MSRPPMYTYWYESFIFAPFFLLLNRLPSCWTDSSLKKYYHTRHRLSYLTYSVAHLISPQLFYTWHLSRYPFPCPS